MNEYSMNEWIKWSDVWPSMVTHTWNLCSAFNPSKCTHTRSKAANAAAPGSSKYAPASVKIWLMALDLWLFPSPTRPTHIASTPIATTHIGVDHSNEFQMLESSCLNVCTYVCTCQSGDRRWNEALRNVLKMLCSSGAPSPSWSARGVRFRSLSLLSLSLSVWGSYVKKILKAILTDYTCISQYPQYIFCWLKRN